MQNIPSKSTGDTYTADEFNQSNNELKNNVTDSGQTLSGADLFQTSKASSINAAGADYYDDSGIANAYVISKPGTVSLRSPTAYFEGMRIRFRPINDNTGGSTVNVAGLGVKSILKSDGVSALSAGDLTTAGDAEARFDITTDAFLLKPVAPEATQTSKGIVYLRDQRVTTANDGTDPVNDIDFSGGRFTFDDGTGEAVVPSYVKQLDATFVAGNNQGMLDTGTIANATYHLFAIHNPATGISDYLASTSPTAPTLPSGYTKKRRIWSIIRSGGTILLYTQLGKECRLDTRVVDIINAIAVTATTLTLTVPIGIETLAVNILRASASGTGYAAILTALDETDLAPTQDNADVKVSGSAAVNDESSVIVTTKTNTSGQIRGRANTASYTRQVLTTKGWIDFSLED